MSASHLQDVGCEEMVGFEDIAEYLSGGEPHPGGRNRRRQLSLMDDDSTISKCMHTYITYVLVK